MQRGIDWIMHMRLEPSERTASGEQVRIRFGCETMGKKCELITCFILVSHVPSPRFSSQIGMGWMLRQHRFRLQAREGIRRHRRTWTNIAWENELTQQRSWSCGKWRKHFNFSPNVTRCICDRFSLPFAFQINKNLNYLIISKRYH